MNCSDDKKLAMKKMILEEMLADLEATEGKKLMPKPKVAAVEIEVGKPEAMGEKMDALADGSPEHEAMETPAEEKKEMAMGDSEDDMSDEELKKLMTMRMG